MLAQGGKHLTEALRVGGVVAGLEEAQDQPLGPRWLVLERAIVEGNR